jgi:hypothetical protein
MTSLFAHTQVKNVRNYIKVGIHLSELLKTKLEPRLNRTFWKNTKAKVMLQCTSNIKQDAAMKDKSETQK